MRKKILTLIAFLPLISQPAFADPLYDKGFYAGVLYERNRLSQQYYAMEDENTRLRESINELKEALIAQRNNAEKPQAVSQFVPKDAWDDSR